MKVLDYFNLTWDQLQNYCNTHANTTECFVKNKLALIDQFIGNRLAGELIISCDNTGRVIMVTTRFVLPGLSLVAYLRAKHIDKHHEDGDIVCNVTTENGIVTTCYSRSSWLSTIV